MLVKPFTDTRGIIMTILKKLLIPLSVAMFASTTLAAPTMSNADCMSKMKAGMKEKPYNEKTSDVFVQQFCGCMIQTMESGAKPTNDTLSKCISQILVIDTINDFPEGSGPKDVAELSEQCVKSALNAVGTVNSKSDDPDLKQYCGCISPEIFKLKGDSSSKEDMKTKILSIGDQCASHIKE